MKQKVDGRGMKSELEARENKALKNQGEWKRDEE